MKSIARLLVAAVVLIASSAGALSQTTSQDPLDRVFAELKANQPEKALVALDDVIKQNPRNADAYMLRGTLKMGSDPQQALADFSKAIELKPNAGQAYNQRGLLRLIVNNDLAGALKDLDGAIANNYKDDGVYSLRASLRWQTGDLNGARADMDESIRLNPNNPRYYGSRGDLLMALKEPDRAFADFDYLLKWYEADPVARPLPKAAPPNDGKTSPNDKAKPASDSLIVGIAQETVNPSPADKDVAQVIVGAYVNRGFILSGRGAHDAAMSDFNKALKIDPREIWALYDRANEYEFKGQLALALADIDKALAVDPQNGNFLVEHGVLLLLMGKEKEAQTEFERLLGSDRALWQKRIDNRIATVRKQMPNHAP